MNENIKYRILQSGYWMLFCAGYGYVTYMLSESGYTAGEIGIITAVFGTLAALLQPVLGRLADKEVLGGWRGLLILLAGIAFVDAIALVFCHQKPLMGYLYGALLMLISSMMPMVNAATFYYKNSGITIDFGIARGCGSLCYAGISLLIGRLTAVYGTPVVPIAALILAILIIVTTISMPVNTVVEIKKQQDNEGTSQKKSGFVSRYPGFCIMLLGGVMLLSFHNITNTYLIQILEAVGGGTAELGTTLAIAAVCELPIMFGFTTLHKKISTKALLTIAALAFTIKGVVFLSAGSVSIIYATQILQMFSFAIYAAASVYYAEECMEPEDKISGQSLASASITVGAVIGNLTGGWTLDLGGIRAMLILAIAFAAFGTVLVVASLRRR